MTEPVESDPRELSDAELLRRPRFWRGEGKGAVSAGALVSGYEAELKRREQERQARAVLRRDA
ncbi:hypothetical protein CF68_06860 [Cupriavidus sp. SK-4]|uniref:hypothetical protein n=1 Tax=Cupriavidus sp. SK-4 TaxID=574750 RepID=UPI00044ACA0E|nr:hypothetical protein [Cupriavidus sp. SK-4]EYS86206.1 hypothetical protein CF68_06860 [Cupriavidus sp. SK-4]